MELRSGDVTLWKLQEKKTNPEVHKKPEVHRSYAEMCSVKITNTN